MNHQERCLRVGAAAILCAIVFRLGLGGIFQPIGEFLARPTISSWLIYLETGRIVRFSTSSEEIPLFARESPTPVFEEVPEETLPVFSAQDMGLVDVKYYCTKNPDLEALMANPLDWNLLSEEPTVLILHTHGTESYTKSPGENYAESSAFRTLDEGYNMISRGDYLAQALESAGIGVVHDRTMHDYPSYNAAYENSRAAAKKILKENPSISLILDLHRDAATDSNGKQIKYTLQTQVGVAAKMMFVVGTDAGGLSHNNWPENMSLAVKLQTLLERENPGICRPISFRTQRFNQDLSPGALLVEMGSAGNSRQEALVAAELLAEAIITLSKGTE